VCVLLFLEKKGKNMKKRGKRSK